MKKGKGTELGTKKREKRRGKIGEGGEGGKESLYGERKVKTRVGKGRSERI